ncbi:MAG TPA: NADH-quinone oxidoreductase subunit NuoK, partial [Campylobacterales bacterium]|nr:NADH-quinone oxidoreductase subunit NuoK [Campylobacterales bacterium]
MIGVSHYLILSGLLFSIGFMGVLRRKNLLMLFFATEMMLNASNIAFVAIGNYYGDLSGQMFAFFV